jgi:hypothetical protein
VGAALMYVDKRTDMAKLKGSFHDVTKAPKNYYTSSFAVAVPNLLFKLR